MKKEKSMKEYLAKKKFGFYVTLGVALIAIITALVYFFGYENEPRFLSMTSVWLLVGGAIGAIALSILNLDELGAAVIAVCSLIALMLYIYIIYNYVVVVLVGIDLSSFSVEFISSTVLFATTFVASVVAVFLPKKKAKEEN